MMRKTFLFVGLCFVYSFICGQDAQFSQYYASPLFTNPALAGSGVKPRLMLNYRNQWAGLDANYITYLGGADYYASRFNSGLGFLVMQDNISTGTISSREIGGQYAYNVRLSEDKFIRFGLQGSWANRSLNYAMLSFPDQFNNQGSTGLPSLDPFAGTEMMSYLNVATGAFFHTSKLWLGLAVHNLTRPDQSLFRDNSARLPVRYTVQAGYKFMLNRFENWRDAYRDFNEISISPTFLYKRQAGFEQLDVGVYFTYSPIVLGLWYRGLPIKQVNPRYTNHESLIAMLGVKWKMLNIGYSFDYTISGLGMQSGGAHELSLGFLLPTDEKRGTKRKRPRAMPCPEF